MPCDACSLLALKRWLPIALHTDGGHDERRQGVGEDTANFLPSTSAVNACNHSSRFVYPSSSSSPFGLAGNINFLVFFSRTGQPPALLSGSDHSGLPLTADTLSISPPVRVRTSLIMRVSTASRSATQRAPRPVNGLTTDEAKKERSSEPYRPAAEWVRHGGWARRTAAQQQA